METKSIEQLFTQALTNPVTAQQVYSNDTVDIAGVTVTCEDIGGGDEGELIGRRLHAYPNDKFVSISIFQPARSIDMSGAINDPGVQEWFEKAAQAVGDEEVTVSCPECRFNRYQEQPAQWEVWFLHSGFSHDLATVIGQSSAYKLDACYSTHGIVTSDINGWGACELDEWIGDAIYHSANYVSVYFDNKAAAEKFAEMTGGEVRSRYV